MKLTLVSICAAALAAVALLSTTTAMASPQVRGKGLTGTWTGMTHQDLPPLGPDADFVEWKQRITITALEGHLTYVGVNVRYTCPDPVDPRAGDIAINLSWSALKHDGPRLTKNGGFSLLITHVKNVLTGKDVRIYAPVHLRGVLGKKGAGGRFDLSRAGCSGKGNWNAGRKF